MTVQAVSWLAFMLRYDLVNYDLDHPAYIFSAIAPRAVFSSHFLSGESIYIQYSRYNYGDKVVLAGHHRLLYLERPYGLTSVAFQ